VLLGVLAHLSSADLLQLALVSHRFYSLVCRLLQRRLLAVASLPDNDLIFECYTPAAKLSTPYLSCQFIGTRIRRSSASGALLFEDVQDALLDLKSLGRMYSVFRPVVSYENRRPRWEDEQYVETDDSARELIDLDTDQLFEQLCAVTNVVKPGPRPGLFLSHVNISDGVLRLWRNWLAEMADGFSELTQSGEGSKILWVNAGQTVGLHMRVKYGPADRMPVISGPDDHPAISYRLEYQGTFSWTRRQRTLARDGDADMVFCSCRVVCPDIRPPLGSREVGYPGGFSHGQGYCDCFHVITSSGYRYTRR
jgi:hypothetical protein